MIPLQRQPSEPRTTPAPVQHIATTPSGGQLLITDLRDGGAPLVQMRLGHPWPSSLGSWTPPMPVVAVEEAAA